MDSETSYLININWSRELDNLFCGFFSCCATLFQENDVQDPLEQGYITVQSQYFLSIPDINQVGSQLENVLESAPLMPKGPSDYSRGGGI